MAYLDPNHTRPGPDLGKWTLRVLLVAGLIGFGWFAMTVGTDSNGRPEIVPEPVVRPF